MSEVLLKIELKTPDPSEQFYHGPLMFSQYIVNNQRCRKNFSI